METEKKPKFIQGMVCPVCYEHAEYPTQIDKGTDDYGRKLRSYFGWCFKCDRGFEVIQFEKDGRWFINRYREAVRLEAGGELKLSGNWATVAELPQPAPVVIGSGGQYNRHIEPQTVEACKAVLGALKACANTIELLLKAVGCSKGKQSE